MAPVPRSAARRFLSRAVVGATAGSARVFSQVWCRTQHHNLPVLQRTLEAVEGSAEVGAGNGNSGRGQQLEKSPRRRPRVLLTVSNHASTIDDPLLWGLLLPHGRLWGDPDRMRWVWAAREIICKNALTSAYFTSGQAIPIVRGDGLEQQGVHDAVRVLRRQSGGAWLHVFSEGKVNLDRELVEDYGLLPLRWGIAHLLMDLHPRWCASPEVIDGDEQPAMTSSARKQQSIVPEELDTASLLPGTGPVVLPFYHFGIHRIVPPTKPYYPRYGKTCSTLFGEPLSFDKELDQLADEGVSAIEARIRITQQIESRLRSLGQELRALDAKTGIHSS